MKQKKLYTVSLNFDREKHKELIEWLQALANEEEHSLSSLCIRLLKSCKQEKEDGKNK